MVFLTVRLGGQSAADKVLQRVEIMLRFRRQSQAVSLPYLLDRRSLYARHEDGDYCLVA